MSVAWQESYIQQERRRQEAYERHRRQLHEVSRGLLAELAETLARERRLQNLSDLLEEAKRQHAALIESFTYEAFVRELEGRYPIRVGSYRDSIWRAYYDVPIGRTETLLHELHKCLEGVWRFLTRLKRTDLEKEEEVEALLGEVPAGASHLRQELRTRYETLKAARLRKALQAAWEALSAYSPVAARPLEEAFQAASQTAHIPTLERLLEKLQDLRRTIEQRRWQAEPLLEHLRALDAKAAEHFAAQLSAVEGVPEEAPFQRFYVAMREQLLRLSRLQAEEALRQSHLAQKAAKTEESLTLLRERGKLYYEKLLDLDPQEAAKAEKLYQETLQTTDLERVKLLKDELQLRYLQALKVEMEREVLGQKLTAAYRAMPVGELREAWEALLASPALEVGEAEAFIQKLWAATIKAQAPSAEELEREEAEILGTVAEGLRRCGYEGLSAEAQAQLHQGQMVEIRTPMGPDYAVRLRLEAGHLNARFIRYVEDEARLSSYERLRDKAKGQEWCQHWERILSSLKERGLSTQTRHREEEKFYYITCPEITRASAAQKGQAPQAQQRRRKNS